MPDIHWFRRDLRVTDNPALESAGRDATRVFIRDPGIRVHGVRARYLDAALNELAEQCDLQVLPGDPAQVLLELARREGATQVFCTGDTTPYARRRDARVAAVLAEHGIELIEVDSPYAVPPGELRTQAGQGFRVFTPFYKAWLARGWGGPTSAPTPNQALNRWRAFRNGALLEYREARDMPAVPGTSRLSAALHFGQIHPRTILAEIPDPSTDPFARQLAWREFYADVLWHRPRAIWWSLDERFDSDMRYEDLDDPRTAARYEAWTQGRTGYPYVDAGMRQLLTEGWMHNRLRMVTASFLVKDLHLPWQLGARWFLQQLVDADIANNQLGWQWVAGCGTDAAPYFRIFNPVTQGRRFDPDGVYIRRYVPELADVPDPHEPGLLAADYPAPIVDHRLEREEALARFQQLPKSS
jgi:deoxyribodipyrimidine photo-lyase